MANKTLLSKFLNSAHCLICEKFRQREQRPVGSGIPQHVVEHTFFYDYVASSVCTIYRAWGKYTFLYPACLKNLATVID